jgi:hypothetical protein
MKHPFSAALVTMQTHLKNVVDGVIEMPKKKRGTMMVSEDVTESHL